MIKTYGEYISENTSIDSMFLSRVRYGNISEVIKLIDTGVVNINVHDSFREYTPLMWTCQKGTNEHIEIAKILLNNGCDYESNNDFGETALLVACQYGSFDIAELLINKGSDVNVRNILNDTPLIASNQEDIIKIPNSADITKILLENGADISVHNDENKSCLDSHGDVWKEEYTQELIITGQPQNIKFFDDKIRILPSLKKKYKEVIEMSELGIFG